MGEINFEQYTKLIDDQVKNLNKMAADTIKKAMQIPELKLDDPTILKKEAPNIGKGVMAELTKKGRVIFTFQDEESGKKFYDKIEKLKNGVSRNK